MKISRFNRMFEVTVMVFTVSLILCNIGLAEKDDFSARIDINKATVSELATIPGIGKKKARAVIAYRDMNNGFENIEEIQNVKGIGRKTFEKIKAYITAGGG